jgi:flavin reductase (DIM6/NTAB) family NADH-FMN oxidoreductase RutF
MMFQTVALRPLVGYKPSGMQHTDPNKLAIGKALGRISSGVFILTASHEGRSTAMLASWVQQASFAPPAVSMALAKGRAVAEMIRASECFALSVVSKEDTSLMKRYARAVKEDEDAFAQVATFETSIGVPAPADALAVLECRLITTCDFHGDHELFIGEVVAGHATREGRPFAHVRGNGFHY